MEITTNIMPNKKEITAFIKNEMLTQAATHIDYRADIFVILAKLRLRDLNKDMTITQADSYYDELLKIVEEFKPEFDSTRENFLKERLEVLKMVSYLEVQETFEKAKYSVSKLDNTVKEITKNVITLYKGNTKIADATGNISKVFFKCFSDNRKKLKEKKQKELLENEEKRAAKVLKEAYTT